MTEKPIEEMTLEELIEHTKRVIELLIKFAQRK